MPNKDAHIAAAVENQRALDYLSERLNDFPGWVVVVAFYKALHVVEAMFACEDAHTDDHGARNRRLKDNRYKHIWKNYRPLWQASLIARYLRENDDKPCYEVFSKYMPPETVRDKILNYLRQVEKSACKQAKMDGNPFAPSAPSDLPE